MSVSIVEFNPLHRQAVISLLKKTAVFREDELEVAIEVIDAYLTQTDDYQIFAAIDEQATVLGYICFGKTPLCFTTFDIYWIAVHPHYHKQGVGTRLFEYAIAEIATQQGSLVVIETSSKPDYKPTQRFYEHLGCHLEAQIRDFYAPNDHKLIYTYRITG